MNAPILLNGKYHPLYFVVRTMIQRCHNPKNKQYKDYGARGIFVCDEWKNNLWSFVEWGISKNWQKGLYIDRINNDLGYFPDNCRFVTSKTSAQNRRWRLNLEKQSIYGTGVSTCPRSKSFRARIRIKGKKTHLGSFPTPELAAQAYQNTLKENDPYYSNK